ncbi:MAG: hypothetical protein IRZ11_02135 [Clostridia bacterium]|nr:hypothetical protein [Clostridia bacterium]
MAVGDEERPVTRGMAVVWPKDVPHRAFTHGEELTAIAVELLGEREGA